MNSFDVIQKIKPIPDSSHDFYQKILRKIDLKTKPKGSLGMVEEIAIKMGLIQESLNPVIHNKRLFIFAGDHGITEEGVSAYPAEVTPQMVLNFLAGGAAINVFCRHEGIGIDVVDMGVNYDFSSQPGLIQKKVRKGTSNFLKKDAMSAEEANESIIKGMEVFEESYHNSPFELVGVGEMGIGNTTSASAIISAATGLSPKETTGRGTGINDICYQNKIEVINRSLRLRKANTNSGLDILTKFGGFEIGGIVGLCLAAAARRVPVVLDGLISTAGGLIAYMMSMDVKDYLFAGHKSIEIGQKAALKMMNLQPILDLGFRLGEGTGSALAMNIIDAACKIMREMASFEEAGVSQG
jgi:nicotinate-nucleotide--dimethylbenzimidazole phosphoribosyltransferase